MKKEDVLTLLDKKRRGIDSPSYNRLSKITGYSSRHLKRLIKRIEEEGIDEILEHKNRGSIPSNKASNTELKYLCRFKTQYPIITIAQFKDIYEEDIVLNKKKINVVKRNKLKVRSYSFYESLFKKEGWKSPVKHKAIKDGDRSIHPLREPCECYGHMVQIDGTPFDWLGIGENWTLHLAVDDATSSVLAGWFTKNECLYGYCQMMRLMMEKHGIPISLYSDRHTIFKGLDGNLTSFGVLMKELDIEMIFAGSPEAKGRIERYNGTCQRRLVNDIKRFKIKSYDELNVWFNDFYIKYLNSKFSYQARSPINEFVEIDNDFDYSNFFSLRFKRIIGNNSTFSLNNFNYAPINDKGEIIYIRKGVEVNVRLEILSIKITINRYGVVYDCINLGPNNKGRRKNVVDNSKELEAFINNNSNTIKGLKTKASKIIK